MKKLKDNIKKQYAKEAARFAYVFLGFVSGRAFARGIDFLSEKYPDQESWLKYVKAPSLGIGGYLLSSASDPNSEFLKHFGYGVSASAAYEGIKITPIAKDYLLGIGENMEKTYYREDDKPAIQIGDFGIQSLPIKSLEFGEVQPIEVELPDLENEGTTTPEDLGYNPSATRDTDDMQGII